MSGKSKASRTFTGWHMLAIMVAFFGVIIVVNLIMAYNAHQSWSGLVVPNSYVAGQEFNEKSEIGKKQAALEWQVKESYSDGIFSYQIKDKNGEAVDVIGASALFKRPVGDAQDSLINLEVTSPGMMSAPVQLDDGAWIVEINTNAGLEYPYRDVKRIHVRNGKLL